MTRKIDPLLGLLILGSCAGGAGQERRAFEAYQEGLRLAKTGDHKTAISKFTEAAAFSPQFPQAFLARADSQETLNLPDVAEKDFDSAVTASREETKALYLFNRARFLQRRGRIADAERDFTAAIERQKDWPDPRYFLEFWLGRALFYFETGKPDACLSDCDHILSLKPDPETQRRVDQLAAEARARSGK